MERQMSEIRYVDEGEEWNEEDYSWRHIDDFENYDIIERAFKICFNRKYFKSQKEARKWRKIDGQISRGAIRVEWVMNCLKWAEDKNAMGQAIKVDALGSLILNKAAMQDWNIENRESLRRPEDY
jgi:hypothetical protein